MKLILVKAIIWLYNSADSLSTFRITLPATIEPSCQTQKTSSEYNPSIFKMVENKLKGLVETMLRLHEDDKDLSICSMNSSNSCSPGNNFMSVTTIAEVEGVRGTGDPYSRSLFIKLLPEDDVRCELFHIREAFRNECFAYTEIFRHIPEIEEIIPKSIIGGEEMIVMENLGALGYKMVDKKLGLDLEHSELVMKALGKLHAATFNQRITKGETDFDDQISTGIRDIKLKNSFFVDLLKKNLHESVKTLRLAQDSCLEPAVLLLEQMMNAKDIVKTMLDLHDSQHLKVLCHGDFWINNMLFCCNEETVESVKLLDFQGMSLGSPAVDLWTFFYSSISPELLNTYYDHLVSIYSAFFIKTLRDLNMSKSKIPKIEDIKKEIDDKEMYGFLLALIYVSTIFSNVEDLPTDIDFDTYMGDKDAILNLELPTNPAIVKRFSDITKRCIARGIFSNFEA